MNNQGFDPNQNNGYMPQQQYNPQGQMYPQQQYSPQGQMPPQQQYSPQGQMPPQQQYNPQGQMPPQQNDNHTATILCIISLLCHFVVPTVFTMLLGAFGDGDIGGSDDTIASSFISMLVCVSYLASWVLMIIVRVKYRNSTFGKVLMIVYIVILALGIIGFIILVAACVDMVRHCPGFILP